jgi:hypothetical protein
MGLLPQYFDLNMPYSVVATVNEHLSHLCRHNPRRLTFVDCGYLFLRSSKDIAEAKVNATNMPITSAWYTCTSGRANGGRRKSGHRGGSGKGMHCVTHKEAKVILPWPQPEPIRYPLMPDGVHPSPSGTRVMFERCLVPALKSMHAYPPWVHSESWQLLYSFISWQLQMLFGIWVTFGCGLGCKQLHLFKIKFENQKIKYK